QTGTEAHDTDVRQPTALAPTEAAHGASEDGAEEVPEPTRVAFLGEADITSPEGPALERGSRSRRRAGAGLGIALPVGAESVVASALLPIGADGVGLAHLIEAFRVPPVDVGV